MGLSCWENFGNDPCNKANRTAKRSPIDSITLETRRQNCCVSSVHRTSTIVLFKEGQHLYRSYVKFSRKTVIPVSLASILRPPSAILNQTAVLSGLSGFLSIEERKHKLDTEIVYQKKKKGKIYKHIINLIG